MTISRTIDLWAVTGATGTQTSAPIILDRHKNFAIAAQATGTLSGTLTLESSNDGSTWTTVPGSSTTLDASTPVLYNVLSAGYRYVRAKFVTSATGGNLAGQFTGKGEDQ